MPYPEQINLPFNFSCIKSDFKHSPPSGQSPTEPGFWAIIQGNSLILEQKGDVRVLPEGDLPAWLSPAQPPLVVGLWRNRPLRTFSIAPDLNLAAPFSAEIFNAANNLIDMETLTLGGISNQILHWHRQSQHCARCGGTTEAIFGTWGRKCTSCRAQHFPHIHPCAIVLVRRGNEVLLTRKPEWAPNRYGLVAGFLDFGESLEECAMREIQEETGILTKNIRYMGSQCWPFPAQLMSGFVAEYDKGEIVVDHKELADARWFPINALPDLPPKRSIARWILDTELNLR